MTRRDEVNAKAEAQGRSRGDTTAAARLDHDLARSSRRLMLTGSLSLLFGAGALGSWAALAPLTTAALANGYVKVAGERKTIQHLEGGIVRDILVREGQTVSKGQVLLRLVDVTARARQALLMMEHDALLAEFARLEAERDNRPSPVFSETLIARRQNDAVSRLLAGELNLFNSRRAAFVGQVDVLEQRKRQAREKIDGRLSEIAATRTQLDFILEELRGAESLLEQGMYLRTRYYALKRTEANLEGTIARLTADVAEAQAHLAAVLTKQQRFEESLECYARAAELYGEVEHLAPAGILRLARVRASMGLVHERMGAMEPAMRGRATSRGGMQAREWRACRLASRPSMQAAAYLQVTHYNDLALPQPSHLQCTSCLGVGGDVSVAHLRPHSVRRRCRRSLSHSPPQHPHAHTQVTAAATTATRGNM
jgi:multidrug efflux pump subunit AcrA (membrane-fusion protein)